MILTFESDLDMDKINEHAKRINQRPVALSLIVSTLTRHA